MNHATDRILIDTGPLVAILDRNDAYHSACVEFARELPASVYTCWPVLTEACYLLRKRPDLVAKLLEACHDGIYTLLPIDETDIPDIGGTLAKYGDQQIDLADACLVHLANREGIDAIMTIDRRHFSLFRTSDGKAFSLYPNVESER